MALPNPGMDAVPFTPLTAEFLDDMIENIESLSDGSGLGDASIAAPKIDFSTLNTFATGSGSVTSGNKFTGWSSPSLSSDFTYGSGMFTATRAGTYKIEGYIRFSTSSAGTSANNEFFRTIVYKNGNSQTHHDAPALRSTIWDTSIFSIITVDVGDTISYSCENSAGLSGSISVGDAQICISRLN